MDCREFRNKHVAFVDDLLPAAEMDAMQRHLFACGRCSRLDTAIRRSLLLVHNLPPIQPSHDFMLRLNARLARLGPASREDVISSGAPLRAVGAFAALAAGIGVIAYMSISTTRYFDSADTDIVAPGIAALPELTPAPPLANAAFVTSVPTGIPIWPAVIMAGQAPGHFANMDLRQSEPAR